MRLVIREYLASLRERGELDAILPDLLTEMGLTVFTRAALGTRQYGVDVGAVGPGPDGIRRVYLFSVKSGDLDRSDWNTASPQSLKPSLDEIQDVYLRSHLPIEYTNLPVVICLCFGGDVTQQVRPDVSGYIAKYTTEKVAFEEWNGDKLADAILNGVLREELLPPSLRSHLRKAAAMVEEPDIAVKHFLALLHAVTSEATGRTRERLARARLINICLWVVFVWAREAGNVEAPYRLSEIALLTVWHMLHADLGKKSDRSVAAGTVFNELVELHVSIWTELYGKKVLPHAGTRHGLAASAPLSTAVDVNLKLFDTLGRLALQGLWRIWEASPAHPLPTLLPDLPLTAEKSWAVSLVHRKLIEEIDRLCDQIMQIVVHNRALLSPIGDWQAIDIGLAFTLLATRRKFHPALKSWVGGITERIIFTYRRHLQYPTANSSYWDLVDHPAEKTDKYRREATAGSILYPQLAVWASVFGETGTLDRIAKFAEAELGHCALQTWFPGDDSEEHIYLNTSNHGLALTHIPIKANSNETFDFIFNEVAATPYFDKLSAISQDHWPVLLTACRHHRYPVPPHLWRDLFAGIKAATQASENEDSIETPPLI